MVCQFVVAGLKLVSDEPIQGLRTSPFGRPLADFCLRSESVSPIRGNVLESCVQDRLSRSPSNQWPGTPFDFRSFGLVEVDSLSGVIRCQPLPGVDRRTMSHLLLDQFFLSTWPTVVRWYFTLVQSHSATPARFSLCGDSGHGKSSTGARRCSGGSTVHRDDSLESSFLVASHPSFRPNVGARVWRDRS